ncbi:MAG TPA: hypothetical protein VLC12_12195, partial [Terriglobales bacterium]|nr:hypothetical protein [Terriglobales bacterium]
MKAWIAAVVICIASVAFAQTAATDNADQSKAVDRVQAAAEVVNDIMATPDKAIPEEVMGSAQCVAVVPSMLNGGFIFGGRYGRGV